MQEDKLKAQEAAALAGSKLMKGTKAAERLKTMPPAPEAAVNFRVAVGTNLELVTKDERAVAEALLEQATFGLPLPNEAPEAHPAHAMPLDQETDASQTAPEVLPDDAGAKGRLLSKGLPDVATSRQLSDRGKVAPAPTSRHLDGKESGDESIDKSRLPVEEARNPQETQVLRKEATSATAGASNPETKTEDLQSPSSTVGTTFENRGTEGRRAQKVPGDRAVEQAPRESTVEQAPRERTAEQASRDRTTKQVARGGAAEQASADVGASRGTRRGSSPFASISASDQGDWRGGGVGSASGNAQRDPNRSGGVGSASSNAQRDQNSSEPDSNTRAQALAGTDAAHSLPSGASQEAPVGQEALGGGTSSRKHGLPSEASAPAIRATPRQAPAEGLSVLAPQERLTHGRGSGRAGLATAAVVGHPSGEQRAGGSLLATQELDGQPSTDVSSLGSQGPTLSFCQLFWRQPC